MCEPITPTTDRVRTPSSSGTYLRARYRWNSAAESDRGIGARSIRATSMCREPGGSSWDMGGNGGRPSRKFTEICHHFRAGDVAHPADEVGAGNPAPGSDSV